jgi:DNA polymerase-3 subunit delta
MVLLLLNADEYLAAERLAATKAALGDPEMASLNTAELTGGQTSPATILGEAMLMPFLAVKRLVIVRGYLDHLDKRMGQSKSTESTAYSEAADLLARLGDAPDTCDLIFVDNAVDRRRGLWKGFTLTAGSAGQPRKVAGLEALIKTGVIQSEELTTPDPKRTLPGWIQQRARARNITIAGDAVAVLADFVGPNLRQLDNELEKLSLYALGRTISVQDVRSMVSDASEELIWNLTDGLGQRNPRGAMRALRDLRRNDESPIGLLASIARQYRLLITVKTAMQTDNDENSIAKRLGENPYPVRKAMQLAPRYTFAELEAVMAALLEADMAMKTGANQDTELDLLVAELTRKQ